MLILGSAVTDLLRITPASAGAIAVHVSYVEIDTSAPPVVQDANRSNIASITGATTTTILAGAASRKRNIKHLNVRNTHATVSNFVTIFHTDGTNSEDLIAATLLPGETLTFNQSGVWVHYDVDGCLKPAAAKLDAKLRVTADVTNATTSFADITGLTVALQSGKTYAFEAHLYSINNATTTGSQYGYNIGAAPTVSLIANIQLITPSATAGAVAGGSATARDTAASATGTGAVSVKLDIVSGYIQPSADGTFAMRVASEVAVAAGVIVKAGSWLRIWQTDN